MYGAYSMFGVLCVYSVKGVHNELGNPPTIEGRHMYLVKAESVLVNDFTNKNSTNKAALFGKIQWTNWSPRACARHFYQICAY